MTIGWNKLKKFFMADMSQNRNTNASFSLGHWETNSNSGTQYQGSNRNAAQMPQVKPLPGDYGPTKHDLRIAGKSRLAKTSFLLSPQQRTRHPKI
jgi:hypothetical protein